jgi:hypothetical protein
MRLDRELTLGICWVKLGKNGKRMMVTGGEASAAA